MKPSFMVKLLQYLIPIVLVLVVIVLAGAMVLPRIRGSASSSRALTAPNAAAATASNAAAASAPNAPAPTAPSQNRVVGAPDEPAAGGQPGADPSGMYSGGTVAGAPPGGAGQPGGWTVYTDQKFGFSVEYPDVYLIQDKPLDASTPNLVHQVLFYDKALAHSDTAALQGPQFAVYVYENADGTPLERWLDAHAEQGGSRTPATIGNATGYKVQLDILISPGTFYYVAKGKNIYQIVPQGPYAERMLQSFKLG